MKKDQWRYEDDVDAQMAVDINRDRNMMDYVLYNQNGVAFVTLAGIMKVANDEGFTAEICEITRSDISVEAIVKVTAPAVDESQTRSAWSGREEYRKDSNGKPDKFAITKAINIATKNACKTLLYGHPAIEQMLTDFQEKNMFIPPEPVKSEPVKSEPVKSEPVKSDQTETKESYKDIARRLWEKAKPDFIEMNVHHDTEVSEVFRMWCFYRLLCAPEKVHEEKWKQVCEFMKEKDYGPIGKFYQDPPKDMDTVLERHDYVPTAGETTETN